MKSSDGFFNFNLGLVNFSKLLFTSRLVSCFLQLLRMSLAHSLFFSTLYYIRASNTRGYFLTSIHYIFSNFERNGRSGHESRNGNFSSQLIYNYLFSVDFCAVTGFSNNREIKVPRLSWNLTHTLLYNSLINVIFSRKFSEFELLWYESIWSFSCSSIPYLARFL